MYLLVLLPIVYLAAVLDTSVVDVLRIGPIAPDLLALVAVLWLLFSTGPRAFVLAGLIMLVGDLISPGRPGVGMAAMLAIGYVYCRVRPLLPLKRLIVVRIPIILAVVTAWAAIVGLAAWALGDISLPFAEVVSRACGVGFYTAAIAIPLLLPIGWLEKVGAASH